MCRAGANSCHIIQLQDFDHGHLRSRCHRHRSGRICLRDPRGAARHEGRRGREERRPSAAPASISAACRRRRCCTPPKCSRKPGTSFAKMGVSVSAPKLDLPSMMNFKQQGIDGNVKGVDFLMKKNKIDVIHGKGKILGTGKVEVSGSDGKTQIVETKNIVIATGSDVAQLKGIEIDEKRIVSSTGALSLRQGAGEAVDRRRRRDRARARLGVAPARRAGHGGGISRPHSAGHGRRGRQAIPAHPRKAGLCVQALRQGHRRRHLGQDAARADRAGRGRQVRRRWKPTWCWWRSGASPTPRASA